MRFYPNGKMILIFQKGIITLFNGYFLFTRNQQISPLFVCQIKHYFFSVNSSQGLNYHSHPLQLHELETMRSDSSTKEKLLKSFQMMLKFYGSKLSDEDGTVIRKRNHEWHYKNLNRFVLNNFIEKITFFLNFFYDFKGIRTIS